MMHGEDGSISREARDINGEVNIIDVEECATDLASAGRGTSSSLTGTSRGEGPVAAEPAESDVGSERPGAEPSVESDPETSEEPSLAPEPVVGNAGGGGSGTLEGFLGTLAAEGASSECIWEPDTFGNALRPGFESLWEEVAGGASSLGSDCVVVLPAPDRHATSLCMFGCCRRVFTDMLGAHCPAGRRPLSFGKATCSPTVGVVPADHDPTTPAATVELASRPVLFCHSLVLSAWSEVLRASLNARWTAARGGGDQPGGAAAPLEVEMCAEARPAECRELLRFMYTGKLRLTPLNVVGLLQLADYYGVPPVKRACGDCASPARLSLAAPMSTYSIAL